MKKKGGFTLVDLVMTVGIISLMFIVVFLIIAPESKLQETRMTRAILTLEDVGNALRLYSIDNNGEYPEETEGIPVKLYPYIVDLDQIKEGPWEGSYYDYDNLLTEQCFDDEATGTVQVAIRNVPLENPEGGKDWTLYYKVEGKGTANCIGANWNKGTCVNCE